MSTEIDSNDNSSKNNNDNININVNEDSGQAKQNTSNNPENNHFIESFLSNKISNIIILVLLPIIIITELSYRKPLFSKSISIEKNIQDTFGGKESIIIKFFKIITDLGGEYFMVIGIVIVYWFFSIIETFTYVFGFLFSVYIHSVMKIWYASLRPYWEESILFMGVCDGGFGNPSGHALISFFDYLTLLHFVLNHKHIKDKIIVKIILVIIFLLWTILVAFSRIVLGVHSINQIIYGTLLGVWIFVCIIYVFKCDKMTTKFYRKFFRENKYIIFFPSYVILCLVIAVISHFTANQDLNYNELNKKMNENCSELSEYKRFNSGSLYDSILISIFMGLYCGQCLFWYLIDNKYKKMNLIISETNEDSLTLDELINNWSSNRSQIFKPWWNIFKIIIVLIISVIPIVMYLFIPKSINVGLMFTFRVAVPLFMVGFLLFSIGLYGFIFIACGDKEVLLANTNEELGNKNEKVVMLNLAHI